MFVMTDECRRPATILNCCEYEEETGIKFLWSQLESRRRYEVILFRSNETDMMLENFLLFWCHYVFIPATII